MTPHFPMIRFLWAFLSVSEIFCQLSWSFWSSCWLRSLQAPSSKPPSHPLTLSLLITIINYYLIVVGTFQQTTLSQGSNLDSPPPPWSTFPPLHLKVKKSPQTHWIELNISDVDILENTYLKSRSIYCKHKRDRKQISNSYPEETRPSSASSEMSFKVFLPLHCHLHLRHLHHHHCKPSKGAVWKNFKHSVCEGAVSAGGLPSSSLIHLTFICTLCQRNWKGVETNSLEGSQCCRSKILVILGSAILATQTF